ncbi:MAG: hypothetical protein CMI60_04160 [Parvibaculum sp.]|nr:hypothetical protein [Parvibaculum sp.]|tara:strand:+ start:3754 stop:4227 length:474 start_codon:yes stop_codon:yes gene_type:complete
MNAVTPIEMEGVVERFDDMGALEEGWAALSKADLRDEEMTRKSVARVRRAFVITVLILLVFNSAGLVQLVQGLSIGPVQDTIIVMSETWHGEMERHGVADVLSDIRTWVTELVQRSWDDVFFADPDLRLGEVASGADEDQKDRTGLLRGAVLETSGS